MRAPPEQHLALGQRLMHQTEVVVLEIAQPAMDELGRGGRRRSGEVALLAEKDRKAASGGVAGNAATVDATADDGKS